MELMQADWGWHCWNVQCHYAEQDYTCPWEGNIKLSCTKQKGSYFTMFFMCAHVIQEKANTKYNPLPWLHYLYLLNFVRTVISKVFIKLHTSTVVLIIYSLHFYFFFSLVLASEPFVFICFGIFRGAQDRFLLDKLFRGICLRVLMVNLVKNN